MLKKPDELNGYWIIMYCAYPLHEHVLINITSLISPKTLRLQVKLTPNNSQRNDYRNHKLYMNWVYFFCVPIGWLTFSFFKNFTLRASLSVLKTNCLRKNKMMNCKTPEGWLHDIQLYRTPNLGIVSVDILVALGRSVVRRFLSKF